MKTYLQSHSIRLRSLEPADISLMYLMENDTRLWPQSNIVQPYSRHTLRQFIDHSSSDIYQDKQLRLTIELLSPSDTPSVSPTHNPSERPTDGSATSSAIAPLREPSTAHAASFDNSLRESTTDGSATPSAIAPLCEPSTAHNPSECPTDSSGTPSTIAPQCEPSPAHVASFDNSLRESTSSEPHSIFPLPSNHSAPPITTPHEATPSSRPIGFVDLIDFSPRHLRAEVGIGLLPNYHNQGIASQALELLHQYAADVLLLHQLYAYVSPQNQPAVSLFTKLGYKSAGKLQDWIKTKQKYTEILLFQKIL